MSHEKIVLHHLARFAYRYEPGAFTLASGQVSDEYLDCKAAFSRGHVLQSVGAIFADARENSAVAIGGLGMGAAPIAIAASMSRFSCLSWFSVRKEHKSYGCKKLIEGGVEDGDKVIVVDDVMTTGASTIEAIWKCRQANLDVVQVLVLVDREQDNGMLRVRDAAGDHVPVQAFFTISDIRAWL